MERIRIPQGEIEVRDIGRGAPIVFVHGLLVDGELWRKVVPPLSASHRCIVPTWPLGSHTTPMAETADLSPPGMAEVVLAALDALDVRDVTLVGNDSGGAICQMVCAKRPARVGRLVLTNCDAFDVFPPPAFGYLKLIPRIPGLAWAMSRAMLRVPRLRRMRTAYGALTVRPLDDDLTRRWVEPAATRREIRRDLAKFLRRVQSADPAGVGKGRPVLPGRAGRAAGGGDPRRAAGAHRGRGDVRAGGSAGAAGGGHRAVRERRRVGGGLTHCPEKYFLRSARSEPGA